MIYLDIDIAKLNHFADTLSSDGDISIGPFKFSNDYDGFYLLLSKLVPLDQHSSIISLESTAYYNDHLVRFLIGKDFKACVLSSITTSAMRKNSLCKTKTDKADTFVIAKTPYNVGFPKVLTLINLETQRTLSLLAEDR